MEYRDVSTTRRKTKPRRNVVQLDGYSSGQNHFSEIDVNLVEKNKLVTHSVQRCLEMRENKQKIPIYIK